MTKEERKEYMREYRKYNKDYREKTKKKQAEYYLNNKDKFKEYYKKCKENQKEKIVKKKENNISRADYMRKYRLCKKPVCKLSDEEKKLRRKEYLKNYKKNRYNNDPLYKLKCVLRANITMSFSNNGYKKYTKTEKLLGASFEEVKTHIETQFDNSMTWENHGVVWEIDHIIPLSSANTIDDVYRLNHYTNLQPLDKIINRYIKSGRLDYYKT